MHQHIQPPELPKGLREITGGADFVQDRIGCSKALLYHLPQLKSYLKIGPSILPEPLAYEAAVLDWLHGRLPVPEVLYYERQGDWEYLLISEVSGLDLSREEHRRDPKLLVRLLASGLRQIHGVDTAGCPFDQTVAVKIEKARSNLERGLLGETLFEPKYQGWRAWDLFNLLLAKRPSNQDLCFTHGDYCLPNVLAKDSALSGFVDLGRAGIGDRYVDIALAVRSLEHNGYGSPELIDLFFSVYGLSDVDEAKMEFYTLLDEFL